MADPAPLYLSPERLEQLQRITDAIRLRAALYPPPKPPRPRRRTRQYPGGRPTSWRSAHRIMLRRQG
ncbi:hypothetical protein AB0M05_34920 [Streptomyces violaceusniger]|uniref:hypothetical protein n=1 Tax=Streptomyces violaceusniger TaxID=68280 RepID=UPI003424F7D6